MAFVRIVSSMSYRHAYHHCSGSTRGQWIVPVSEWYPQICLLFMAMTGWQNWLWSLAMQARPSMRISFHGWRSIMLRRSRWMPERTTILRPSENIVRGNLMDQDVSEILTSSESRVAPSLANPGNKQQSAQRYLYQLFLSSPTWCLWHVQASGCQPLRVSMFEVRLYSDHL